MAINATLTRYRPWMLSLLRIIVGFLFMEHGGQKLFALFGGMHGSHASFPTLIWFAGLIEFFGGLLILVGLCTRVAAFICAGEMAYAYFTVHAPGALWPILNGGEPAVLYCFVFLYFVTAGGGPISLDHLLWRKR
jgi:putative oxidoreductase